MPKSIVYSFEQQIGVSRSHTIQDERINRRDSVNSRMHSRAAIRIDTRTRELTTAQKYINQHLAFIKNSLRNLCAKLGAKHTQVCETLKLLTGQASAA